MVRSYSPAAAFYTSFLRISPQMGIVWSFCQWPRELLPITDNLISNEQTEKELIWFSGHTDQRSSADSWLLKNIFRLVMQSILFRRAMRNCFRLPGIWENIPKRLCWELPKSFGHEMGAACSCKRLPYNFSQNLEIRWWLAVYKAIETSAVIHLSAFCLKIPERYQFCFH